MMESKKAHSRPQDVQDRSPVQMNRKKKKNMPRVAERKEE